MKKVLLVILIFASGIIGINAQSSKYSTKWLVTKPFERNVFIENKGQFPDYQLKGIQDKVLYYTTKGKLKIYYAPDGLVFEYDTVVRMSESELLKYGNKDKDDDKDEDGEGKRNLKLDRHFVKMQWEGGSANPQVEVQNPVSDYFTYGDPKNIAGRGITAHGFGKLIYRNVYPGIDVVFYYPEEKGGLEYDVIVHPGADVSAFKMKYTGATTLLDNGAINISTNYGINFMDHSPEGTDESGNNVSTTFKLDNNTASFVIGNYDRTKTLTIDPWLTATAFATTNKAYDLDYDVNGNVYIYGGGATTEYQEKKYNNAGALQWTFTTTMPYVYIGAYFFGGMVADERTGTTYICEGFDPAPGDNVIKVNANGVKLSQYLGPSGIDEMWHMAFDYCNNHLLYDIGGGANDAAYSDTNVTTVTGVNIFGAGIQDQTLVCTDGAGNGYIGSCQMVGPSVKANYIAKCPLPALSPVAWSVYDRHPFIEITNINYYPIVGGYAGGNGFNGLVANSKIVVSYDGGTARIWRASTGIEIDSMKPSATHLTWGGLDLDCKSNIYCGNNTNISVYDSSANFLGNIGLGGTVYALRWDPRGLVYAAGNGFVQAVTADAKMATTTKVQPGCGCNGSATAIACGVGPFTYSWSNGATTSTVSALCTGSYTVTITGSGCFPRKDTSIVILTGGGGGLTLTTTQTNVACNGGATGIGNVGVVGGTPPYTYAWTPTGGTNASATGLTVGTYTITVKDKNGCIGTASVTITQPPVLTATTTNTPVKCNGGTTGSATVTAGGGTPAYAYAWAPSGGTNALASNLTAGTYTVTVTDANGCTITATATITQPTALTATTTNTPVKCNGGATGTATVTAGGGTPAYIYSWAPSGGTNALASNLTVGTYTVTVTDANGCTKTATATITQPPVLTATTTNTPVKCNGGATGTATVTAGGGTPAYVYAWAPSGGTNALASNLTVGTYTVTVTDANGCTITATATITQPPVLTATTTNTPVKCNGGATGSATVTAGGGTPAYIYSWAPSGGTNALASNLTVGTYTVTVTDANGCTKTAIAIITQPPVLTATTINTPVKCNGGATGSATVTAGGGTPAYNYSWAPSGGTNALASNLTAGTYTVTVTDANGCTITATATITQPTPLTATTTTTLASCGGSNGTATVTAGGGTPGYNYSWAPSGGTNALASNLTGGVYTVTVTDANGCTITATANVANAAAETASITASSPVKCNGGATGSATVTAVGGTPGYNYSWAPSGGTNATASNISAGTYTVTVHDANGCIATASVTITQPTALTASTTTTPVLCNGGNTGSATVTAGGGTGAYAYAWAPSGGTNALASNLSAGTYTITVTDANGCTITATAIVTQPTALTASTSTLPVLCNGGTTGSASVIAGGGIPAYAYSWAPSGGNAANATGLSAGTYTVTVTDANGCTITASATVVQPTALTATTTTVQSTCGNSNGSATVTAGGGTPAYGYVWSNGQTSSTATGLSANTYTVTVTDANGCTITATGTVANAAGETVAICGNTPVSCNGGNNGTLNSCVVGGTGPYSYAWTLAGGTNALASNLSAATYTVTVTDANGCVATASATITQPTALTASTSTTPVLCNGGSTGSATVIPGGGTPAYGYSWAPSGGNAANATGLSAGTYTITITDANGCTLTASATVTQPTALTIATTVPTNVSCNGGNNGTATATAGGGTPAYGYVWSNGQTGSNATGLSAATYTVTATDANGCTITATATITQPTVLTATTTTVQSTCGNSNGSATVTAGGGTPAYKYVWSNGQTSSTATGLSATTYTVTVTDANGCTFSTTATVTNAVGPTVTICGPTTNVSCNGGSNGGGVCCVAGGTPAYTYLWTPSGQTTASLSGVSAGTYTITVHDANGCVVTASATITQPPLLTVTASVTTNVTCNAGNNGSLGCVAGGGTPAYKYAWTPAGGTNATASNLTAGTYTITVTDANGCTATAKTTITQPPVLTLAAAGFPVTCNGGSDGSATAIPGGGTPAYTYAWAPSGGAGAIASNLTAGTYTITVTDAHGCSHDTTVTVTQPNPIVVTFNADSLAGCAPLCVNFKDLTVDAGGIITKWNWSFGDGDKDSVKNPRHCYSTPGSYNITLTVVDNHGCTSTLVINNMITVYSFPVPAFTFGPQPATITDPTISFADKSTDAYGIATWLWDFNDPLNDKTSNMQNPSHTYGDTGTFCATLTVTNVHGCTDSVTECLVISSEYTLYIPNSFSPNADGLNDIFKPKGDFVTDYKMYIFDRWGMLLFTSSDINTGWDGTVSGGSRICQEDTYVYLINITDNLGKKHSYLGRVTLIR